MEYLLEVPTLVVKVHDVLSGEEVEAIKKAATEKDIVRECKLGLPNLFVQSRKQDISLSEKKKSFPEARSPGATTEKTGEERGRKMCVVNKDLFVL